jgi:folylpolyglutamate synthase/dihydropteroate synthase
MRALAMAGRAGRGDNSGMTARTLTEWLAYIERQHPKTIAMGLERVRVVAERMALAKPARHVITVGGTNGKGSTVAFIEAIARAAGWRVGTYTSPHLLRYNRAHRHPGRRCAVDLFRIRNARRAVAVRARRS